MFYAFKQFLFSELTETKSKKYWSVFPSLPKLLPIVVIYRNFWSLILGFIRKT